MPADAKILDVQMRNGCANIWALVDVGPDVQIDLRTFQLVATGEEMPDCEFDCLEYVGTFYNTHVVYHLFEEGHFNG